MKRSDFLRSSFLLVGGTIISNKLIAQEAASFDSKNAKRLVILHTNDTHSNIEPFPSNHNRFPNQGGVARRFQMIQEIREQNEHVLLIDAGDIFQGTPYFNRYHGHLEMRLMSEMGYEVATMGNHDFDIGIDGFLSAYQKANFPFVNCNYDFGTTPLASVVKPYIILKKAGLKIGILGVGVELEGLVSKGNYKGITYNDAISCANETASELKKQGCDLIICLSHIGYDYEDKTKASDLNLAKASSDIHLIIGGHTHTFLEEPTLVKNKEGRAVLVNQVGYAGLNLGRIELILDKKNKSIKTDLLKVVE